jgi:hypothetical protein
MAMDTGDAVGVVVVGLSSLLMEEVEEISGAAALFEEEDENNRGSVRRWNVDATVLRVGATGGVNKFQAATLFPQRRR